MRSEICLPTEIVALFVLFVAADNIPVRRQRCLHACCLVSRQWYSAFITMLYEKPHIGSGIAFRKFTQIVCPPVAARRRKWNLGAFVRRLDLSGLVYHSSNSLTARLLGQVKSSLEILIAPRVSFASNSLPSLSKCLNLSHLDLSLVSDHIPFPHLKKAIRNLRHLVSLFLPRSTVLSDCDLSQMAIEWPPNLRFLQVSGTFTSSAPSHNNPFPWPPCLTDLSLTECSDLSTNTIIRFFSNPLLLTGLKRLSISPMNRNLQPESINLIPLFLPALVLLSVPGDLIEDSFFNTYAYRVPPLELEVLELTDPIARGDRTLSFSIASVVNALEVGLANLRAVGFSTVFCDDNRIMEDEEIDNILQERGLRADSKGDIGVYFI